MNRGLHATVYTEEMYKDKIRLGERIGKTEEEYSESMGQANISRLPRPVWGQLAYKDSNTRCCYIEA